MIKSRTKQNVYQAEIDSACELIDFLRFNVHYLTEIYKQQPISSPGVHNRMEWRPLEGFVLAVTPFNFTAIGGNLPTSAAMCGNVVVWKPANTQVFAAQMLMRILKEAGLPDGVINLIYVDALCSERFAFPTAILEAYILPALQVYLTRCGKPSAKTLPPISYRALWRNREVRIL